jgi:hypothetical protein
LFNFCICWTVSSLLIEEIYRAIQLLLTWRTATAPEKNKKAFWGRNIPQGQSSNCGLINFLQGLSGAHRILAIEHWEVLPFLAFSSL